VFEKRDADERRLTGFVVKKYRRRFKVFIMGFKYRELTEKIIEIFYKVYNKLGYGFLEKVYRNAMILEFKKVGISAVTQFPVKVVYDGETIGEYFADILVDNSVVLEIKATKTLLKEHEAQLLNYLKATNIEVGLLLNFGPNPEVKRKAFDNTRKQSQTRAKKNIKI
jgi:GxxExxY protein